MGVDLGENDFGFVFPQGETDNFDKIEKCLKERKGWLLSVSIFLKRQNTPIRPTLIRLGAIPTFSQKTAILPNPLAIPPYIWLKCTYTRAKIVAR